MSYVDYIIVGHGLAGAVLAEHLSAKNKGILVIDKGENHSSKVAAGIINPIVFKRINKSWRVDDLLPKLNQFYQEIDKKYSISILETIDVVKLFTSIEEQNNWLGKMQESAYENYLFHEKKALFKTEDYQKHFGYGTVKNAARLDINTFLDGSKAVLKTQNAFLEEDFDHKQLKVAEKGIKYKSFSAKHIIFCEGYQLKFNPLFKDDLINHTKGEILDVKIDNYQADFILNKGFFMYPNTSGEFTVGATYDWHNCDTEITEKAQKELLEKLSLALKNKSISVINQKAGIRPTTKDRRPILGAHKAHKNVWVFNGLGTKGVMLAPYFAEHLLQHIEENVPLEEEVDIQRFYT